MANKLLEEIKNMGYDHDTALEILKKAKEAEGTESEDSNEEEEEEEETQDEHSENDETNDKGIDIDITKLTADITKQVSASVKKQVDKTLKDQLKKLRIKPPKGEVGDEFMGNNPFVKKNLYERRV